MMVRNDLDTNTEGQQTDPKCLKGVIGVKGVIPHQITLMSPFSEITEMDQITGSSTYLEMWPALALHLINPSPSTHGDMGCGWASYGCYPKVIARSSQGHSKVKLAQNG